MVWDFEGLADAEDGAEAGAEVDATGDDDEPADEADALAAAAGGAVH